MRGRAFAEIISVEGRIDRLLNSSRISLDPASREILELVYKEVESFEEIAKRTLHSKLDEEINSAVIKLYDVVRQIDRRSESRRDGIQFSIDDVDLKQKIHSFTKRVKEMEGDYVDGLYNSKPEEEEEDVAAAAAVSSRISCGGRKSKMVGVSDVYKKLKDNLMRARVISLVGMPGIGKTTLAKEIFEDPELVIRFDHRVWIRIGKKCQLNDIRRRILAEMDPDSNQMSAEGDEDIARHLKKCLKDKRYLIVLDDVWDKDMACLLDPSHRYMTRFEQDPFLGKENKSLILLTSRLQQINEVHLQLSRDVLTVRLLKKEESWDLLCKKVFPKGSCPPQLEKAGKKIAENCDGLPLTIVTVADLLSKKEKNPQYWEDVAANKNHQLFMAAYDEMSKVLLPSYTYLPRLLQMCFLFMGLFPQNCEVRQSKLINIWVADGFLELNVCIYSDYDAIGCLEELDSNNLVMVYQKRFINNSRYSIKTCGLHSSLWHLSNQKARETKFSLVLNSHNDDLGEGMKGYHRLSFHNNILFAIKDVHKSVEDNCASIARSLLCYGPYSQYQVPICFGLGLLRELDALSIRFNEFPVEVVQLVHLRYLALTLNGMIPASISQLSNLQFLIVDRHLSIKSCRDPLFLILPLEIWDMKELKHLQVMGSDLPNPCGASLKRLSTLLNVSAPSCTEVVLKAIPKLRKLGIRIELAPDDDGKPLSCFVHISLLGELESLKCIIVNPEVVPPIVPFLSFPSYLKKLSLSGLGYPWKEMSKIASIRYLEVLKLENFAFRGPKWEVEEGFTFLHSLVIEDTDLVEWKIGCEIFGNLWSLRMKHCYKLEKIHGEFGWSRKKVELVDCNPLGVEEMKKATSNEARHYGPTVYVQSSWDDGKLKT